jgi:hypothetical protein
MWMERGRGRADRGRYKVAGRAVVRSSLGLLRLLHLHLRTPHRSNPPQTMVIGAVLWMLGMLTMERWLTRKMPAMEAVGVLDFCTMARRERLDSWLLPRFASYRRRLELFVIILS